MRRAIPILAVLVLAVSPARAEKADREKPTQIEANRMSADDVKRMTIFEGNVILTKGTIAVRAERGAVSPNGEEIFLYDNVVLVREADQERPEARLTTSFLHVLRERNLVRTDREVLIVEDTRSLSGRGMEYDNESRVFTLMADVRGRYEPKSLEPKK